MKQISEEIFHELKDGVSIYDPPNHCYKSKHEHYSKLKECRCDESKELVRHVSDYVKATECTCAENEVWCWHCIFEQSLASEGKEHTDTDVGQIKED